MTILDTLAEAARRRVERARSALPLPELRRRAEGMETGDFPFRRALSAPGVGFICEAKRASPSRGLIVPDYPHVEIARQYQAGGAAALSVLTEPEYFLGRNSHLTDIRAAVSLPLLRKDFTVDEYQIYEAKTLGADAVLLIAALLDTAALADCLSLCRSLGLSSLAEAHSEAELDSALKAGADIVGVNNRDLKTFRTDFSLALALRKSVPPSVLFVAESGVRTRADVEALEAAGVDGVLVGETLMKSPDRTAKLLRLRGSAS